jgi:hypothetical protein
MDTHGAVYAGCVRGMHVNTTTTCYGQVPRKNMTKDLNYGLLTLSVPLLPYDDTSYSVFQFS